MYCLETGVFAATKEEFLPRLSGKDVLVLETAMGLREGKQYGFDELFPRLYTWCQESIQAC